MSTTMAIGYRLISCSALFLLYVPGEFAKNVTLMLSTESLVRG